MNLQKKSILFFDVMLLVACVILGIMGYRSANHGFELALEAKANADMRQTEEILELVYPGPWQILGDGLYKGDQRMDDAFDLVDHLGELTGNNITIFREDTRVATTFAQNGKRSVGTKASPEILDIVLKGGNGYTGEAEVLGNKYFCAYRPIKDSAGKNIGMLFMGIPKAEVEKLQKDFLYKHDMGDGASASRHRCARILCRAVCVAPIVGGADRHASRRGRRSERGYAGGIRAG